MTVGLLLTHFERLSEAPNAIPALRRFILALAVHGSLVAQDLNDESVIALLTRNDQLRQEIAKKDRRANAQRQGLLSAESRWNIPPSWAWCALSDLVLFIDYRGKTPNKTEKGVPLITAKNVRRRFINTSPEEFLSERDYEAWMTRGLPMHGDILFTTEAPMGNAAVVRMDGRFALAQRIICFRPYTAVNSDFLTLQLLSEPFQAILQEAATGLTAKGIKAAKLRRLPTALPPLAEQERIVAKVDELMALCDRLELAQAEREDRRGQVAASCLSHLEESPLTYAKFYLSYLPRLTTRHEQVRKLRQTILSLAVRGLLVHQDPNDTAASGFLKQIKAAKSDNEPFPLPASWAWISVDQIGDARLGKMLDKAKNKGIPRRYLRNVNVRWFDFDLSDVFEMRFEDDEIDEFALRRSDVLICEGGEPGRAAVWDEREQNIYFQKAIHRVRFTEGVEPRFFVNVLRESADSGRLSEYFTGVGIKHFTGKGLASFVFPLPPLPEQRRIVAKVDELMALCDRLENQIATAQSASHRLLEAILHQALSGNQALNNASSVCTKDSNTQHTFLLQEFR
jgi:type I restriction enzyme S subunit